MITRSSLLDLISTKEVTGLGMAGWRIDGGHRRNEQANYPNSLDRRRQRLLNETPLSCGRLNLTDIDYYGGRSHESS